MEGNAFRLALYGVVDGFVRSSVDGIQDLLCRRLHSLVREVPRHWSVIHCDSQDYAVLVHSFLLLAIPFALFNPYWTPYEFEYALKLTKATGCSCGINSFQPSFRRQRT